LERVRLSSVLLVLSVASAVILSGCSGPDPAAPKDSANAQPVAPPKAMSPKKASGGVMDMTIYPAPAGVKTGVEGGKKD